MSKEDLVRGATDKNSATENPSSATWVRIRKAVNHFKRGRLIVFFVHMSFMGGMLCITNNLSKIWDARVRSMTEIMWEVSIWWGLALLVGFIHLRAKYDFLQNVSGQARREGGSE